MAAYVLPASAEQRVVHPEYEEKPLPVVKHVTWRSFLREAALMLCETNARAVAAGVLALPFIWWLSVMYSEALKRTTMEDIVRRVDDVDTWVLDGFVELSGLVIVYPVDSTLLTYVMRYALFAPAAIIVPVVAPVVIARINYGSKLVAGLGYTIFAPALLASLGWWILVQEIPAAMDTRMPFFAPYFSFLVYIVVTLAIGWSVGRRLSDMLGRRVASTRWTFPAPFISTAVVAFIYYVMIPRMMMQLSVYGQAAVRLFLHPLIYEVCIAVSRFATRAEMPKSDARLIFFIFPPMLLSSIYGRFLLMSGSPVFVYAITVVLGLFELALRLSVRQRDEAMYRLKHGKSAAKQIMSMPRATRMRCMIIAAEMCVENTSIIVASAVIGFFGTTIASGDSAPTAVGVLFQCLFQLFIEIIVDAIALLVEGRWARLPVYGVWVQRYTFYFATYIFLCFTALLYFFTSGLSQFLCGKVIDGSLRTIYC